MVTPQDIEAARSLRDELWANEMWAAYGEADQALHALYELRRKEQTRSAKARRAAAALPKFTRGHVSKSAVIARDGLECHLCGVDVDPQDWHLEHVIPLALGGTDCLDNAAVAHPSCNLSKSDSWAGSLVHARWIAAHAAYRKAHKKSYRGPIRSLEAV